MTDDEKKFLEMILAENCELKNRLVRAMSFPYPPLTDIDMTHMSEEQKREFSKPSLAKLVDADALDMSGIDVENVEKALFMLKTQLTLSPDEGMRIQRVWDSIWKRAGHDTPPALVILDKGMKLECLTPSKLTEYGLKRL